MKLYTSVKLDENLINAIQPFDYNFNGNSVFELPDFNAPKRDNSWAIGLIVGSSGSGKTSLLKHYYGITNDPDWNPELAIVSQVEQQKLSAVGLNSVPSWCRPFHVLSNGEQFRARLARILDSNVSIDEFTSVIDRTVAKSSCHATQRYIRQNNISGVVFSTCHYDIIEWLQPDWIFDTQTGVLTSRRSLRSRPEIQLEIYSCTTEWWEVFRHHHYLDDKINKSARCFLGLYDTKPIAFGSALAYPSGTVKNAWREHRTVVLPDYQGLGIGVRFSDFIAKLFTDSGHRYFSKTAHPRMGEYRNRSPLWKATSKNGRARKDYLYIPKGDKIRKEDKRKEIDAVRTCYSHEYLGAK
jgi:energy-coupling factor transporter ATP-binding protein EcfA2